MNHENLNQLRSARADDIARLMSLWELLYDEVDTPATTPWKEHARQWFARSINEPTTRIPVRTFRDEPVAAAIGTLELGVPNPQCSRGRLVRLANVVTLPSHRGLGHATALVRDVIAWARSIDADRVDLSATPEGRRIYEQLGFRLTTAPRMKLVL